MRPTSERIGFALKSSADSRATSAHIYGTSRARARAAIVVLILGIHLIPPPIAQAQPLTEILLSPTGITLSGAKPTYERTIAVPARYDKKSGAHLRLEWVTSDLIDLTKSVINVFLDGAPLRSSRLQRTGSDKRQGKIRLRLPAMAPGFHRLSLHVTLRVPGDPCLNEHEEATWLRITPESSVVWREPRRSPAPVFSLRRLTATLATMHPAGFRVHYPVANEPGITEAAINLDHWLKDHNLATSARPDRDSRDEPKVSISEPPPIGIVMATLDHLSNTPVHPMLEDHLTSNPALHGAAHLSAGELHILGKDGEGLSTTVSLLTSKRASELCQTEECYAGAFDAAFGDKAHPGNADRNGRGEALRPSLAVLTLGTHGHPAGWTAQGSGTHRLSVRWIPPPNYTINHVATLELDIRVPVTGPMNRESSRLRVDLNGTPLAGYTLDRVSNNIETLKIGIPKEYNTAQAWHFEIEVRLRNDESQPCTHSNDDLTWLVIGPGSTLNVPRQETAQTGISELLQMARQEGLQIHQTSPLSPTEVSAISTVTYGFRNAETPPVRVHASGDTCLPLCLSPVSGLPEEFSTLHESPIAVPIGGGGLFGVPALLRDGILILKKSRTGHNSSRLPQLDLWISPPKRRVSHDRMFALSQPAAPSQPDWKPILPEQLDRDVAVYAESRWSAVGVGSTSGSPLLLIEREIVSVSEPLRTSDQEDLWIKINLLWLFSSLASLAALTALFRFTRTRTRSQGATKANAP